MTERRSAAAVLVAASLTLTSCATSPDRSPPEALPDLRLSYPVVPTDPAEPQETVPVEPPDTAPQVTWADDGESLAVTTWGSSSCPSGPTSVTVDGHQEVQVALGYLFPGRDPCTADMAPTTTEVDVPDSISVDEPVTVRLEDAEPVTLPPAGG